MLRAKTQILIVEGNYTYKELLIIPDDVYNMTIAAYLTGKCSPEAVSFALKKCIFVFLTQIFIPLAFSYGIGFENFQPLNRYTTFLRIIAVILITLSSSSELYTAIKMLTYLKRMKGFSSHKKAVKDNSRIICVFLSCMQVIVPLITVFSLVIKVTQEKEAG